MKRILLTGGGTAGHVWPVISVIEQLHKKDVEILYIGSVGGIEEQIVNNFTAFKIVFKPILAGKFRNYFSILNFTDMFKTAIGLIQALYILISFKPDAVFAKGGYVTFPVIFWSNIFNVPIVIHESDSIMGKANKMTANKAKRICTGFPSEYYDVDNKKMVYTGNPIRADFFDETKINSKDTFTILITGGSQGSMKINQIVWQIVPELVEKYKIIHFVGERNLGCIPENILKLDNYFSYGFADDISNYLKEADLVISRAGANTLSELATLSKATIVIPLPTASMDHQSANADIYKNSNAVELINEKELTPSVLVSTINDIVNDKKRYKILQENINKFSCPTAAKKIADIILEEIN